MKQRTMVWGAVVAMSLGGCVTAGKYDDLKAKYEQEHAELLLKRAALAQLQQEHTQTEAKLAEVDAQRVSLDERVTALQGETQTQQTELERLRAEETRLRAEEARLGEELANVVRDRSSLRESAERLQLAVAELAKRRAEAERRVAEFRNLLGRFKSLIDAGKLKVKILDGRMVLALPSDVLFDSGSATLSSAGLAAVTEVTRVLADMGDKRFQVEGHTDNVPIRTNQFPSNWELANTRALGVVKAMVAAGMPAGSISAAGFGEHRPIASNDTPEGRMQNRRIEIVLLPDLSMLPGFDELTQATQ